MEKYKFTLNGTTLLRNPENWKDIQVTLERQKDIEGLLLIFTSNFLFVKDGYDLLKTQFDDNYNNRITANIDILNSNDTYDRLFTGVILLSDIQFNLNRRTATVKIEDVSFFGAIDANKNIKTFLNSEFSKNGVQITTPTAFKLDYFNPSTGVFFGFANRDHYLVSDALDFLVRFMTDDVVKGITSTYLTTASNFESGLLYIITGEEIRTGTGLHPNISFKGLFQFLQRTHNISFVIETDGNGDPVMRIEEKSFFFKTATSFTIRNIRDLELKADKANLFSHLEVGNKTFEKSGNFSSTTRFFSFREEDYIIEGAANIDRVLDFKTDFITDNNVIEKILIENIMMNDDEFDEDTIIVTGNTAGNATIAFTSPNFHYNRGLTNDKIMLRQINSIPNSVAKYISSQSTPSRNIKLHDTVIPIDAPIPSIIIIQTVVDYPIETYDLGSNYNNTPPNFFYEIPFDANFTFKSALTIGADAPILTGSLANRGMVFRSRVEIQRWNPSLTSLQQTVNKFGVATAVFDELPKSSTVDITTTMTCAVGEKIRVRAAIQVLFSTYITGDIIAISVKGGQLVTNFLCVGADNNAGTYQYFDPADFRVLIYSFRKNTNFTDFNTLTNQSLRQIIFNEGSDPTLDKTAWIDKIDYKVETSETNYQLIT